MVPLAGIEPALLAELDFESSASTSSATGALQADLQAARIIARNFVASIAVGASLAVFLNHFGDKLKSSRKVAPRAGGC